MNSRVFTMCAEGPSFVIHVLCQVKFLAALDYRGSRYGTYRRGHCFLSCAMLPSVSDLVDNHYLQLRCRKLT